MSTLTEKKSILYWHEEYVADAMTTVHIKCIQSDIYNQSKAQKGAHNRFERERERKNLCRSS